MDPDFTAEPSEDEPNLETVLSQYGLDQYEECLKENGFDTWERLTSIIESDMKELGFKLGHRRQLQRAIEELTIPAPFRAYSVKRHSVSSGAQTMDSLPNVTYRAPTKERIVGTRDQIQMLPKGLKQPMFFSATTYEKI